MFIHDIIKMKFVREGYLMNWPYHLLSDEEMCDAFLTYPWYDYRTDDEKLADVTLDADEVWSRFLKGTELCYFRDMYPLHVENHCGTGPEIIEESKYRELVEAIAYHINVLKTSHNDIRLLPDWIYSYMLGSTLGPYSSQLDLHSMFVMMDTDNDFDECLPECTEACYNISKEWLKKIPDLDHRPPTMFGEPHVIKYLRLEEADLS